ncbi:MAG: 4Fe-4S binding protein [Candidatus Bathyarchaeia archaeon]
MKARLKFDKQRTAEPVISTVVLKTKALINILKAEVDESAGEVLIEIPDDKAESAIAAFEQEGVTVQVGGFIEISRQRCIDCGHCITLCPVQAISADEDLTVILDQDRCINCGACVDCCPTRAISMLQ